MDMDMVKTILGFTIAQIDAATCYLTVRGSKELKPCDGAYRKFENKGKTREVNAVLFRRYSRFDPRRWLFIYHGCKTIGPSDGWGWKRLDKRLALTNKDMARYLKAYIMKHGRRGDL